MSKEQEIAGLEYQLAGNKEIVSRAEDVRKLCENRLFRKVILEQFCEKECARYVQESGDPLLTAEQRADALAMAQAAGHIRRWLDISMRLGDQAIGTIERVQEMLDTVRAEPDEDEKVIQD